MESIGQLKFIPLVNGSQAPVEVDKKSLGFYVNRSAYIPAKTFDGQVNILRKGVATGNVLYKGVTPVADSKLRMEPDNVLGYSNKAGEFGFEVKERKSYSFHVDEIEYTDYQINVFDLVALWM